MWLAKQQKRPSAESAGSVGQVTLAGDAPAVELDSERRGLAVYAPGGYRWRPAPGQKVLVLKADGQPCVAGTPSEGGLQPGEVALNSAGGASVKLDNQGNVAVTGTLALTGALTATGALTLSGPAALAGPVTVGGTELTALIRSIAAQVAASMMGG